ncbi:MAG: hypothetical protein ACFB0G_18050 [Leptolyngbyaceae cyanobacterium]
MVGGWWVKRWDSGIEGYVVPNASLKCFFTWNIARAATAWISAAIIGRTYKDQSSNAHQTRLK